ncbi:hypothetical protein LNP08_01730 [Apilactobacillus ozensis]|nr:hypothetical protein [Apilactobacillus ozensis]MCK8606788.1 hypothetical protein [Apilactobacillus ozensis]
MGDVNINDKNTLKARIMALVCGLILNAFGNALTIVSSCGSGIWTAAAVNINKLLGFNLGLLIFTFGIINAITNQVLLRRIDIPRFVEEIIFISGFSYFINIFTRLFTTLGWENSAIWIRIPMSLIGVMCFCTAISLYQRANLFMHPNDDTTNILRFKFLNGSAILSQLIDMIPPIIIIIVCSIPLGQVYSVGVGTIFSVICNGIIIQNADKLVFPSLKHNKNINEQLQNKRE